MLIAESLNRIMKTGTLLTHNADFTSFIYRIEDTKETDFFNKYALFTVEVARIVINISNAFLSLTYKESDLINNKL